MSEHAAQTDDDGVADDRVATSKSPVSRRTTLRVGAMLGFTAVGPGTGNADPQGQVGDDDVPVTTVYLETLNGGITGGESVTKLAGTGLRIDESASLVATKARLDVEDGTTSVTGIDELTFGHGLSVTDDGDGTVTVRR